MDVSTEPSGREDATELHRYAEALLTHLTADGTAPPFPDVEVPGYWLSPAVQALVLIMHGEDALEPLARAARLDGARTSLFLCLALAVCGHGDRIHASWLGTAFGDLSADRPVTSGQRALWLAAARGAYGPAGKIFVLRKLDSIEVPPEDELWLKALVPESGPVVPGALADYPELADIPALGEPVRAASRLTRLRERCEEILSVRQAGEVVAAGEWPEMEPVTVLRALIREGDTDGPLSSLSGHLLHDVAPGADPHVAALALHVAAPAVRAAAERLAESSLSETPESVAVPIFGNVVLLRPDGPDSTTLAEAERLVVLRNPPRRPYRFGAYALLGLGATCILAGILWISLWPLLILGAGLCGFGGYRLWRSHQHVLAELSRIETELAGLHQRAESAVWALHEYARESKLRSEQATDDLAALTRLLRRGPRAG
ncbi:hypothetical protein Aph01nite_80250 [Acrocarpospora phusangensis]|uniref:Uncharacterized protein n=1 Tax=Acrocarpospora phusangensis TaxID=1070424 RepID=A0A919QLK0_9ACTN|nr:hypothetical protein [Acrocarpospora phusangensis]GIH29715.1 hypothetical protein Aph01nite_80250 [Acrocarpospora phusangensis]